MKGKGKTDNPKRKQDEDDGSEEIPSDLEDEELDSGSEPEPEVVKKPADKFEEHRAREMKVEKEYYKELRTSRIEQLEKQNEEEDKIIGRYEKLLKLKRKKKNRPTTTSKFNDGLEYLLELCTDDSIKKMYSAAKEVAEGSDDADDDGLENDLNSVFGPPKKKAKKQKKSEEESTRPPKVSKRSEKLKEVEKKYFGDDEDFFNNFVADSCDETDSELESDAGGESEDNEEDDDDSEGSAPDEIETKKKKKKTKKVKFVEPEDSESEVGDDFGDSDDVSAGGSDDFGEGEDDGMAGEDSTEEKEEVLREDIYGRTIDKHGRVVKQDTSKYVPPAMRAALKSIEDETDPKRKEKLQGLKRNIKSSINKLAESNLHRITMDIENLYRSNARNDVNNILMETIMESLITNVLAADRLVLEQTLLMAVLHANIGSEIGAFFLQNVVERFHKIFADIDSLKVENKELDNVIFIICHLYTFKLFKHDLIYDILDKLCSTITEKRIECVLLILRTIGFILRKDDPLKLKEFILKAQKLAQSAGEETAKSSRVMFMLDVLMAVKNNNMTKIPQFDSALVEHFKKLLKTFVREGNYVTTLAITLEDLLNADDRGKWWVVGSAWTGHEKTAKPESEETQETDERREKIFELARKQRMNTDVKRNIFYILLSAEDYLDAFEKIIGSVNDERSVVAVIVHCSLSEKSFNPYYSVIAKKFCEHNRKYFLALQFTFWDKFKELSNMPVKQISNLAKLIAFLIENGTMPLSVLKVIEFNQIDKSSLRLLRQVMLALLLTEEEKFQAIFEKISQGVKLNPFKDQLRLFLKVFIMKDTEKSGISEDHLLMLKNRTHMAEKLLSTKQF